MAASMGKASGADSPLPTSTRSNRFRPQAQTFANRFVTLKADTIITHQRVVVNGKLD